MQFRNKLPMACLAALFLLLSAFSAPAQTAPTTVVLMTDFGHLDDAVPICKGVIVTLAPQIRLLDLTQDVIPFNILQGARYLSGAAPYYPAGTVFVAVVDPGVGSTRKPIVAKTKRGQYFVLPDNGLLTLFRGDDAVVAARQISNREWMLGDKLSSTFHGRDIFAPVGGHIAAGEDWTKVGPEIAVDSLVRLNIQRPTFDDKGMTASIIDLDGPFGNLITNVNRDDFAKLGYAVGDAVPVRIGDQDYSFPLVKTFSDVPVDSPLFFIDSRGRLSLAVNQGSFARKFSVKPPVAFLIPVKAVK